LFIVTPYPSAAIDWLFIDQSKFTDASVNISSMVSSASDILESNCANSSASLNTSEGFSAFCRNCSAIRPTLSSAKSFDFEDGPDF
jgi:hypothetical protein